MPDTSDLRPPVEASRVRHRTYTVIFGHDTRPGRAFDERTTEQLFESLGRDLDGVDLLRVVDPRWLSEGDEELQREFDRLLSSFRDRGGRVEFG